MFRYTTAIKKIRAMKARKKVIQGGTSAGKTYAIIPILIDRACKTPKLKITVVAETIPAVKDGAVDIFKTIMQETNRWIESHWIGSPMEYTFSNGSRIQFKAFENVGKAKAAGKRDILFINEANHIDYGIADALMIRSKETYLDYNPDFKFWAHTETLTEPNSELLILTYEDNEALPPETLEDLMIKKARAYIDVNGDLDDAKNIRSQYWANWWKVYGLGHTGTINELRIMPFLNKCKEVPADAIEIPSGLDFGWFPDPTSFCRFWIRPRSKTGKLLDELYIKQVVYDTKLSIDAASPDAKNLCNVLTRKGVNKAHLTIAECADPRAINDMRHAGFNVEAVKKSSIETSVRKFHEYEIYIVIDDDNRNLDGTNETYEEFDNYRYDRDRKTNEILSVPAKGQPDHSVDNARYVLMSRDFRWSVK